MVGCQSFPSFRRYIRRPVWSNPLAGGLGGARGHARGPRPAWTRVPAPRRAQRAVWPPGGRASDGHGPAQPRLGGIRTRRRGRRTGGCGPAFETLKRWGRCPPPPTAVAPSYLSALAAQDYHRRATAPRPRAAATDEDTPPQLSITRGADPPPRRHHAGCGGWVAPPARTPLVRQQRTKWGRPTNAQDTYGFSTRGPTRACAGPGTHRATLTSHMYDNSKRPPTPPDATAWTIRLSATRRAASAPPRQPAARRPSGWKAPAGGVPRPPPTWRARRRRGRQW